MKYKTETEFIINSDIIEQEAVVFQKDLEKSAASTQKNQYELYSANPTSYHIKYLGIKQNLVCYDANLKKIDRQNYNIISKVFNNTVNVLKNIGEQKQCELKIENKEKIKILYQILPSSLLITSGALRDLLIEYNLELDDFKSYYQKTYPLKNKHRITVYDFNQLRSIINLI